MPTVVGVFASWRFTSLSAHYKKKESVPRDSLMSPRARCAPMAWRLLLAVLLVPLAAAHGEETHLDEGLTRNGERLLLGSFEAPQPGPLVVVPFVDAPLGCDAAAHGYRIPLGDGAGVAFVSNRTTLQALLDAPEPGGYAAFAVDTHEASRALILMQENAVALHALVALVQEPGRDAEVRTGALGVPYTLPGAGGHGFEHAVEGGGIQMAHDGGFRGARACVGEDAGHVSLTVDLAALPDALGHGRLVHALVLHDPQVAAFLPRPLDESTRVLQANLYLARPGEDPARVRDALDPAPRAGQLAPVAFVLVGLALVARPR